MSNKVSNSCETSRINKTLSNLRDRKNVRKAFSDVFKNNRKLEVFENDAGKTVIVIYSDNLTQIITDKKITITINHETKCDEEKIIT